MVTAMSITATKFQFKSGRLFHGLGVFSIDMACYLVASHIRQAFGNKAHLVVVFILHVPKPSKFSVDTLPSLLP